MIATVDIPRGWEIFSLGDLFDFSNGVNADKSAYGAGIPFANVLEVITHETLIDRLIPGRIKLSPALAARYRVRHGDVLFNRTSETQDEVGLASVYVGHSTIVFGGFVFRGRPKTNLLDIGYYTYALRAYSVRKQIVARGQGGIRANIGQRDLKTVRVLVPPLAEQRQIAEDLTIIVREIGALERLIAKKEAVKQGVVQQLLTGKTRLPGYEEQWSAVTVGELAEQHRRTLDPRKYPTTKFQHFSIPAFDDGRNAVWELGSKIESTKFSVPPGAVLVSKLNPRIPRIWAPEIISGQAVSSTEFIVMTPRNRTDRSFFHWLMQSDAITTRMKMLATGTTGSHARVHPHQIAALDAKAPGIAEQTAIGAVLNDVQANIDSLRQRLIKARSIKQGMMQELLTGRTRLPVTEEVAA